MSAPLDGSLMGLAALLERGAVSSLEVVAAALARIEAGASPGAFLHVDADGAREAARASDARRAAGEALGPLDGVPLGLKDNLLARAMPLTCGSRLLEGFRAPYDATVTARLRQAGAVLLGKLNLDEFGMGSSNEHSAFGPVPNPWDATRVAGGSSGGPAAAVASGAVLGALGSDTGGSVRQPAAFCGVVGLRPTYGRVSRRGLVAYASSLDQVGPIGRETGDVAAMLAVVAGEDPNDATSARAPVPDFTAALEDGVRGVRLGLVRPQPSDGVSDEVRTAVEAAAASLTALGATLVDVELPSREVGIAAYQLLANAEASSNLARFDGVRYGARQGSAPRFEAMLHATRGRGLGPEVKRRILLGTFTLSAESYEAYYVRASRARRRLAAAYHALLAELDAIVTPTTPTPAFHLGEKLDDPLAMYRADAFTVGPSLAGLPAISIPCGFSRSGLPIGVQLIGRPWQEAPLLAIARAYEREHPWHTMRPGR